MLINVMELKLDRLAVLITDPPKKSTSFPTSNLTLLYLCTNAKWQLKEIRLLVLGKKCAASKLKPLHCNEAYEVFRDYGRNALLSLVSMETVCVTAPDILGLVTILVNLMYLLSKYSSPL